MTQCISVPISDEKEDVDMEGCPTSNGNANGSASGTTTTGASGIGKPSVGAVGGSGKGRKGDVPIKKEPDGGRGTGADGDSKDGDVDMKLPLHAIATHPVSNNSNINYVSRSIKEKFCVHLEFISLNENFQESKPCLISCVKS
jgi:hypothetical protein